MAVYASPDLVVDTNLRMLFDAGNTKSYPGSGNECTDLTLFKNILYLATWPGTLGGPTFSSANGGSIVFNGANHYAAVVPPSGLAFTEGTICMWVYPTSLQDNFLCFSDNTGPTASWSHTLGITNGSVFKVMVYDVTAAAIKEVVAGSLTLSTWYHVTLWWKDGDSVKSYLNGVLQGSTALTTSYTGFTQVLPACQTGAGSSFPANQFMSGNIASIAIYNRALTADEILQNFYAGRGRFGV